MIEFFQTLIGRPAGQSFGQGLRTSLWPGASSLAAAPTTTTGHVHAAKGETKVRERVSIFFVFFFLFVYIVKQK